MYTRPGRHRARGRGVALAALAFASLLLVAPGCSWTFGASKPAEWEDPSVCERNRTLAHADTGLAVGFGTAALASAISAGVLWHGDPDTFGEGFTRAIAGAVFVGLAVATAVPAVVHGFSAGSGYGYSRKCERMLGRDDLSAFSEPPSWAPPGPSHEVRDEASSKDRYGEARGEDSRAGLERADVSGAAPSR